MTWDFEFHGRLVWDCTGSSRRVVSFHFKRRGASVAARERRSRSVRAYRGGRVLDEVPAKSKAELR